MRQDPAIQRIRKARHEISARCGHNARALVAYYQAKEADYRDRLLKEPTATHATGERNEM